MGKKTPTFSKLALSVFLVIYALTFLSSSGSGGFLKPSMAEAKNPAIGLTKDNPGIKKAIGVQRRNSERLMDISGVVGHGIGISSDGEAIIKIFVERAGIPRIPVALEGVPTKVEVTGMVIAYADPTERFRPVPIGVSTGHPDITAGTIGARVKDFSGNVYALSNNHVYANCNDALLGDSVLQPGTVDGGNDPVDAIGSLYDYEPINFSGGDNLIDAAIAEPLPGVQLLCSTPAGDGYGTPSSTIVNASIDLPVQKYGRTTGWTHGQVATINTVVDVCYEPRGFSCVKEARFVGQISITPGTFGAGGDSGSLIVTDDGNNDPVGLVFAGNSTHTFANPIGLVLDRFDVSVDNCSGSCTDNDGDGSCVEEGDCDDSDVNIYPGASEAFDDGVENDCDGNIDEGCVTCGDDDLDGFDDAACGGTDCDDTNRDIYPGASEVCDDGVDNNCDGSIDEDCSSCLPIGAGCSSDEECCTGKCRGRPGRKTCR